jgi:hypothetical protein
VVKESGSSVRVKNVTIAVSSNVNRVGYASYDWNNLLVVFFLSRKGRRLSFIMPVS